jgi:nicotinamide-nucleotide amidase
MTSSFPIFLIQETQKLMDLYRKDGWKLAVAESCTGGLFGGLLTSIPGASEIFQGGVITYSNASKTDLLGVPETLITRFGAVSESVAQSMAERALELFPKAHIALSITGLAGPKGDNSHTHLGTVWLGCAIRYGHSYTRKYEFPQISREDFRLRCLEEALHILTAYRPRTAIV